MVYAGAMRLLLTDPIRRSITALCAGVALDAFEEGPGSQKYPAIALSWRRLWEHISPFFVFGAPIRRIIRQRLRGAELEA